MILSPVLSEPPPTLGRFAPTRPMEELMDAVRGYMSFTPLQNMAGTPALSVPSSRATTGGPIGAMFSAARGREQWLLALAAEISRVSPWEMAPVSDSIAREVTRSHA
jgi:amidase